MKLCPHCSDPMNYNAELGGIWQCPNRCQTCEASGCNERICGGDEADGCVKHNLEAAIEDMNDSPFSQEAQMRVAKWRIRLDKEAA